jgi:hypothetical protein
VFGVDFFLVFRGGSPHETSAMSTEKERKDQ